MTAKQHPQPFKFFFLNERVRDLTTLTSIALVAAASTRSVVALSAGGAITALRTTKATQGVRAGGALHGRAIMATETGIALASVLHGGVKSSVTESPTGAFLHKSHERHASTMARAVTGADSTLGSITSVASKAFAFPSASITRSTSSTLNLGVSGASIRVNHADVFVMRNVEEI